MATKPTSFKAALSFPNRTIAHFYSQLEQQRLALQRIHEVLPAAIAKHALHCVVHGKKLLVYTDTAAWASQLRFYNSAILAAIAPVTRDSVSIMLIKIRIDTPLTGRKGEAQASAEVSLTNRKPIVPSAEKIEMIRNHSLIIADEQLKQALLKLSTTLTKLSERQASGL